MNVCTWCATLTEKSMCPRCAAQGHLYRTVDDGPYGFAWLRERWERNCPTWKVGLLRLAKAEATWREYHAA